MELRDIVVATITWARNETEERTLMRSVERLATCGMPLVVADRTPPGRFRSFLDAHRGLTLADCEPGLVRQVAASLECARTFDRPFVLYTEPDKQHFFDTHLHDFIARASHDAGVVIASRSPAALDTFPPMQRYTEGVVNHLCAQFLGAGGDYCYGPFLMNRDAVPDLGRGDGALGWGWRPFTFLRASRRGLRLEHVEGDYPCPPDAREEDEDERRHRLRQLCQNIAGLTR